MPTRGASMSRFAIDQGPRTYVERIDIHGNTRTRGYVIRREFDIAEGDAYNKALIDRAERRLKNLNYFKTVKISNKPGSAPDRVVLDVEVAEQSTGDFTISGGYSTTDGLLAEVKLGDSNFLGTGAAVKTLVDLRPIRRRASTSRHRSPIFSAPASRRASSFLPSRPMPAPTSPTAATSMARPCARHADHRAARRAVALLDLSRQNVTLDPTSLAAAPSLPIQQAALAGPPGFPPSATPSLTTRSTIPGIRPAASVRNSGRISPASAAT